MTDKGIIDAKVASHVLAYAGAQFEAQIIALDPLIGIAVEAQTGIIYSDGFELLQAIEGWKARHLQRLGRLLVNHHRYSLTNRRVRKPIRSRTKRSYRKAKTGRPPKW